MSGGRSTTRTSRSFWHSGRAARSRVVRRSKPSLIRSTGRSSLLLFFGESVPSGLQAPGGRVYRTLPGLGNVLRVALNTQEIVGTGNPISTPAAGQGGI